MWITIRGVSFPVSSLLFLAAVLAIPFVLAAPLAWWARRIEAAVPFAGWIPTVLWLGLPLVILVGILIGATAHRRHALANAGSDPALRSKILADGIAEGMNCATFGVLLILGAAFVALLIGQIVAWSRAS